MPFYDKKCADCGEKFTVHIEYTDTTTKVKCPKCKSGRIVSILSRKQTIIFKGEGFTKSNA
jgi:putative FmdB family regulatory protein